MKLYLLSLFAVTCTATAQTGDWPRLQSLRHGSTIIVETNVNPYGPATFDRCHVRAVDANTLTCKTLGWAGKREIFPAVRIDAVYQVKQPWVETTVGVASLGIFIGGVASANAPAVAIGLLGGMFVLIDELSRGAANAWHQWWSGPDPMPRDERRELVYLRPVPPPPTN